VLIELTFVMVVSAGKDGPWPGYMGYYDLLADGFRDGHLHLSLEPAPELVAHPNPYDEDASQYWLGDASYYRGHFYFYWGPAPALLLAAVKALFHITRTVGDHQLVLSFFSLAAIASTLLLNQVRRRLFPRLPLPLLVLAFLACGMAAPVTFLLASGAVYQAAISGGQAFLVVGTLFAFTAIRGPTWALSRPSAGMLALAGSAWGVALACRISLFPAIFLLLALTTFLARTGDGTTYARRFARDGFFLGLPVGLFGFGLLIYNKLRFDEWFEAGVSKQLTSWHFRFSPRFFIPNLHQYFFRQPKWTCMFPYAVVPSEVSREQVVPAWMPFTYGYITPEPVMGLGWALPLVWGIPLAVIAAVVATRYRGPSAAAVHVARWSDPHRRRLLVWCVLAFGIMASATILAPLGLYMATMRYTGDFTFGLSLLGTLGFWALHDRAPAGWRRTVAVVVGVATAVTSILFGLLLGYQGYSHHFAQFNPQLSATLSDLLSFCRAAKAPGGL
jgi:hypothetical protein